MRRIYLNSDYQIVRDMTEWSSTTGQHEPKTGLTLTGFLSTSPTGSAIHASLSKSLVEVGTTARYGAATAATDHVTHLTSILGTAASVVIYDRVTGTGYADAEAILLTAPRQAGA